MGIVMVFTGNGKGKTTAAMGAAMRAVGQGAKVIVIQFMKGRMYGEIAASKRLEGLVIEQHGRDEFVDPKNPADIDRKLAKRGWERALEAARDEKPDLLVLDEINVAVSFGLIDAGDVLRFIRERPAGMDVILTGRYAPDEFIAAADTVTEMLEVKHHFSSGVKARKGIEY